MLQTRRSFLMSFLSSAALPVLGSGPAGAQGFPQRLTLTPHCDEADELTLAQNEGPFFKLNAPLCHDLARRKEDYDRRPCYQQALPANPGITSRDLACR